VPATCEARCFPGFPETNVLGYAEAVEDWHGLSGHLEPTAWWEKRSGQFHHDGGFSSSAPQPPALVSMYCEEAPSKGTPPAFLWHPPTATHLDCPPGATMFFSTRVALQLAPVDVAARARCLRCCYKEGFGRIRIGEYPILSESFLTPLHPPSAPIDERASHRSITKFESFETLAFGQGGGVEADTDTAPFFHHRLVQCDTRGREYVVVHTVCLDHLEELTGDKWMPLSWAASQEFVERLLAPAASPPYLQLIDWQAGDVVLWDNLQTQHSVTPTDAYVVKGQRRLMTRTAMMPAMAVLS